jgi:hypothetical protein
VRAVEGVAGGGGRGLALRRDARRAAAGKGSGDREREDEREDRSVAEARGRSPYLTVSVPVMLGCTSQTNGYVPAWSAGTL